MTLTHEQMKTALHYEPQSGIFRWRISPARNTRAGARAGGISHGYRIISIDDTGYYAHRLAWFYMTGEWPPRKIDHANGDTDDNRFDNLRLATDTQNQANRPAQKNSESGIKGVRFDRGKWVARVRVDGRLRHLGRYTLVEDAKAAYAAAARRYFGEFSVTARRAAEMAREEEE